MCMTCGCGHDEAHVEGAEHSHPHADGAAHSHAHGAADPGWHTHADGTTHRHAVVPAHATKTRSAFRFLTCCANGVKSVAVSGTETSDTVWPFEPTSALTAA